MSEDKTTKLHPSNLSRWTRVSGDLKKKKKKDKPWNLFSVQPLLYIWESSQRPWSVQCRLMVSQIPLDGNVNSRGVGEINALEGERSTPDYVLGAWLKLWGWSCCRFCCSCTASCWHWSDVDSLLINADTQVAGMISPVKEIKGLFIAHVKRNGFWEYHFSLSCEC